jgi:hypothetical protein
MHVFRTPAMMMGCGDKVLCLMPVMDGVRNGSNRTYMDFDAQKNAMQAAGVIYYEYMALGDDPCADCQELDGQVFPVQDMKPGENAPPMHPFCHCATGAASNPNYDAWLSFLENGGTTQEFYEDDLYD